jgi:outer membrane lipoprotein-sorting protein
MKKRCVLLLFYPTVLGVLLLSGGSALQDGASILKRMDDVMYSPRDITGNYTIRVTDRSGREEIREATFRQKGTDRRLVRFTSPASQAGIAFLSLPNDVMYVYLPAFGRERRIAASAKNQNFAGTDLTYEDMESVPFSHKYTPKLLRTETDAFVMELTPKERSDYSKIIVRINRTHYYPETMEYYDRGNRKFKEATYSFRRVGQYWSTEQIEMKNLQRNTSTRIRSSGVRYDTGLSDDEFTVRQLRG